MMKTLLFIIEIIFLYATKRRKKRKKAKIGKVPLLFHLFFYGKMLILGGKTARREPNPRRDARKTRVVFFLHFSLTYFYSLSGIKKY